MFAANSPACFLYRYSVLYSSARSQQHISPDSQIKHRVCHTELCWGPSRGTLMIAIKNKCKWLPWGSLLCGICRSASGCQDGSLPLSMDMECLENKHQLGQRRQQLCNNNNTIIHFGVGRQATTILGNKWWVTAEQITPCQSLRSII